MEITVHNHIVQIAVVTTDSRIDAFTAPELRDRLDALVSGGANRFVIDLSAVPFIDSAGLAVLVGLLKKARIAAGDVILVWPSEEAPRRILRITKFDRVFPMADDVEHALSAIMR
jgi:anti-anti-sigma factor